MGALDFIVRSGRALYVGISSYDPENTRKAVRILRDLGSPCLIHQPKYSMFERSAEDGLLDVLEDEGVGCIVFSPLAQGLLTDKYLKGIPQGSRASKPQGFLKPRTSRRRSSTRSGGWTGWRASAVSRWRNSRWRGSYAGQR